jgi:uncharacterized protein YndB with AHSA1/START domain
MADVKVTKDLENKKLILEWVANGPLEKVWNAYADKDMFEQWWGPEGWETHVKEFSFNPGGRVLYAMECVDKNQGEWFGQVHWALMEIKSIEHQSRFSYGDYFCSEDGTINTDLPALSITNEFTEEDGKTRIVSTMTADSADQLEELVKMGMIEGFSSQLNKLDKLVG